jgi:hypothetical protein
MSQTINIQEFLNAPLVTLMVYGFFLNLLVVDLERNWLNLIPGQRPKTIFRSILEN